jgi:hypothetical protein
VSSISDVIDAICGEIPLYTGFTTKKEILNPYSLEDNPSKFLEDSWGLIIGDGTRAESDGRVENYFVTTERSIGVVLCRAVFDVHGIGLQVKTEAKQLLSDAKTIRDNFLDLDKFGVLKGGENISYEGDSGVNQLSNGDGYKFIHTQINFKFDIIETIN